MHSEPQPCCDVVIVGCGITGAWAAKELCEAGLTVMVLEAGPALDANTQGWEGDRNGHVVRQPVQSGHPAYWLHDPRLFVDDIDHPYSSGDVPYTWIRGRQVGGRSHTWGGITLRFSDHEFLAAQADGFGPSWPLTLDELRPSYERVESFLGIHGSHAGLAQLPDGVFTTPPPLTSTELRFKREIESRWPQRKVIPCRGIPSVVLDCADADLRWSPKAIQHRVLPAALRTGRATIRSDCIVARVLVSERGDRVVGVSCIDRLTRQAFEVRGRVVALCASTIESLRILLNSGGEQSPQGLANSSGCLGRFLLDHAAVVLAGSIPGERSLSPPHSGGAYGVVIPKFRNLEERHAQFVRGYGIWGNLGRGSWEDGDDFWSLCAMLEVLPRPENQVRLEPLRTDAWGIPVPRIDLTYSANEAQMREDACSSMRQMVACLGWHVGSEMHMQPGAFVHELGGARMGTDPAQSVLNAYNQSWDLPNLFVLDGACFPTSGWQNPTLTMMALTVRACGFIAQEFHPE